MNHSTTNPLRTALLATTFLFSAAVAWAGDDHDHGEDHGSHAAPTAPQTAAAAPELTQGEVVRWDAASAKVTLRHGPIRNLDMPPMTMVFRVTDPAQAAQVKAGAKVRFRAEQQAGAYVVTRIEPATP